MRTQRGELMQKLEVTEKRYLLGPVGVTFSRGKYRQLAGRAARPKSGKVQRLRLVRQVLSGRLVGG